MQLLQSFHDEFWVNPEQSTVAKPFETTLRSHASVPAITFGQLTHTLSANTLWDLRWSGSRARPARLACQSSTDDRRPRLLAGSGLWVA
jgi:hypothetical protein